MSSSEKERPIGAFRASLIVVLIGLFIYQVIVAAEKFRSGEINTSVGFQYLDGVELPNIMVCKVNLSIINITIDLRSFTKQYEELKDKPVLEAVGYVYEDSDEADLNPHSLLDDQLLREVYGLGYDQIWTKRWHTFGDHHKLYTCDELQPFWTYKSRKRPQLVLNVSMAENELLAFGMGSRKSFIISNGGHFHKTLNFYTADHRNTSMEYTFEITSMSTLNTDENPCLEEEHERPLSQCVDQFIAQNMTCRLPWNEKDSRPLCTTHEDLVMFQNSSYYIHDSTLTESEIIENSGCIPNCRNSRITLKKEWQANLPGKSHENNVIIYIGAILETGYEEAEFFSYEESDFVGDIGGALGLFLGWCCFDLLFGALPMLKLSVRALSAK